MSVVPFTLPPSSSGENCSSVVQIYTNTALRMGDWAQMICAIAVIYTFVHVYWRKRNAKLTPIHKNLQRIFFFLSCLTTLQMTCTFLIQLSHEYRRLQLNWTDSPCNLKWTAWQCLLIRSPTFVCFPAYTLIHGGITIERMVAMLWVRRYEYMSPRLSNIIFGFILCSAAVFATYSLQKVDWFSKHEFCTLTSIPTIRPLSNTITLLAFANIPILLIDIFLFAVNGRLFYNAQDKRETGVNYTLSTTYQLKENHQSTRVILPFILSHVVTESVYLSLNAVVRNFVAQSPAELLVFAEWTYLLMFVYSMLAIYVPYYFRIKRSVYVHPSTPAPFHVTTTHFTKLNNQFDLAFNEKYRPKVITHPSPR